MRLAISLLALAACSDESPQETYQKPTCTGPYRVDAGMLVLDGCPSP